VERKLALAAAAGLLPSGPEARTFAEAQRTGLLDPSEARLLGLALEARRDAIQVDDFPQLRQPR